MIWQSFLSLIYKNCNGGGYKGYIDEPTDISNQGVADVDPNSYHTHRINTYVCVIHVG